MTAQPLTDPTATHTSQVEQFITRMAEYLPDADPAAVRDAFTTAQADATVLDGRRLETVEDRPRVPPPIKVVEAVTLWAAVCQGIEVPPHDVIGSTRTQHIIRVRRLAIWAVRNVTHLSYPAIGMIFGKDHTTVMNAVRQAEARETRQTLAEVRAFVLGDEP
jgi:chromosomal replication initiation ATPase DnaA